MELHEMGEKLVLGTPDPAIPNVVGYRRLLVGLDIAQARDKTAFAIIQDERVPGFDDDGRPILGKRKRQIVNAKQLPAMAYDDLAQVVRNLMKDPALENRAYLVVDASGVGRAFCDILNTKGVQHTRVTMTSGGNESEQKERGITFNNVGRNRLLQALNSAFHVGDLTIAAFPERDILQQELESFEAMISESGNLKIDGGTRFGHADIAVSAALALWLSDHRSIGAHVGETKLRGMW